MYLSEPKNWLSISKNTDAIPRSSLCEAISKSNQNKEQHETTKLLNEEVRMLYQKHLKPSLTAGKLTAYEQYSFHK